MADPCLRGRRRVPCGYRTSRSSPPRRLLLGCSRSTSGPSERTVARRRVLDQTHVRSRAVSCRFRRTRAVDIEHAFESNRRSISGGVRRDREDGSWGACGRPCWSSTRRCRRRGGPGWSAVPVERRRPRPSGAARRPSGRSPSRVGVCRPPPSRPPGAQVRSTRGRPARAARTGVVAGPAARAVPRSRGAPDGGPGPPACGSPDGRVGSRSCWRCAGAWCSAPAGLADLRRAGRGPAPGGGQQRGGGAGRHAVVHRRVGGRREDVRIVVDRIQELNGLDGAGLVPGQVLLLP